MVANAMGTRGEAGPPHPRTIGWIGTTALAMGGSNQSLFLIGALFLSQGSAAVPLLIVGLLLSWAAAFGWTELILMFPNRVGGIAATCSEAFRPYSPVLANLTGVCYWWGWVPTCGLTAILSATAIAEWYLPNVPIPLLAIILVVLFTVVNLCGVRWVTRLAIPIATASALLAFLSGLVPIVTGHVNWQQAMSFHLVTPFSGYFGALTSAMAGLYLVGFAAPAFEAAACHVGETVDPARNVPRAMFASGLIATLFFIVLPVVWLGALGSTPLEGNLSQALGPTFAPLFGNLAHSAAIWFIMFNMFHGTLQPLAGAARTLSQLAEDGLLPRLLALRSRTDTPWVATMLTAGMAIVLLLIGDPTWLLAAANLTYLISICLPSVAVWLLRRNAPKMTRLYRAPRGTIVLGLLASGVWGVSTLLGFEQFGLPTVIAGLAFAYSGSLLYAIRRWGDRLRAGLSISLRSLHVKLTGAMLLVLILDGTGYLIAVSRISEQQAPLIAALEDIFVAVALLTISVGLVLPGMIAHASEEVARAADRLVRGTLSDFSRAMQALEAGNLDEAHARIDITPVIVHTRDEIGTMAASFNTMQEQVAQAAGALDGAREGLRQARDELATSNAELAAMATMDSLTGLPNRILLLQRIGEALPLAELVGGGMALLMLDLDRFKEINDTFGHQLGDQLLQQVGVRLRQAVGPDATVARLGGDEFAVFLSIADEMSARQAASALGTALEEPFLVEEYPLQVEASIGAALYPAHGSDPLTLLRRADVAMYTAKRGHEGYALYDARHDQYSPHRLALLGDLRKAIATHELRLYYQPKAELGTGLVKGVEALMRWQHPTHGFIPPDQFIPLAEQTGLIGPLTHWALETAVQQCRHWLDGGITLGVAVNLSMWNLRDASLPDTIADLLTRYRVPPHLLGVEITESAVMVDVEHALQVLNRLFALGLRIAIDDYGTGYASLSYLKLLPAEELKIDRAFVQHVTTDLADQAIVRSTVNMAHSLGMQVVAEGVEDQAAWNLLETLGCDIAQGFYLSRPVPAQDLERWLGERKEAVAPWLDEGKEAVVP
ncbi:MAG: amino acid permease [Ktedonobacteraceae bacterium]